MIQVVRGVLHDPRFSERYAQQMYRLRYKVFHERLGWDVKVENEMEFDHFDDAHSVYVLLVDDQDDSVCGGWRLRPTTRHNMLADVFPQMLHGNPAPNHRRVWEISRFAIDTSASERTAGFSMGEAARLMVQDLIRFCIDNDVTQCVLVTTLAVERLVNSTGLVLHRFGPPIRVGRALTVACWVDNDAHARHVLLGHPLPLRVAA